MLNNTSNNLASSFKVENERDLKDRLNLNHVCLINKTHCTGKYDFPKLLSPSNVTIDYLALYSDHHEYSKTYNTCVCFYEYDKAFDRKEGLFNSVYYKDEKALDRFRKRFENVNYFISPDYSLCGDCPEIQNIYNIYKSRVVSLALTLLFDKLVIPNITFATQQSFDYMLDGLEECSVVAFSTKGSWKTKEQKELLIKAIRYTVDHLKRLKQIIVYDVSTDNAKVLELFSYAIAKGIEVIIPDNLLKDRNLALGGKRNGQI